MKQDHSQIAVIGSGIVGLSIALALDKAGFKVTIFNEKKINLLMQQTAPSRLLSINAGSTDIIKQLIGIKLDEIGQQINTIHIIKNQEMKCLTFNSSNHKMGYMVDEKELLSILYNMLIDSKISVIEKKVTNIMCNEELDHNIITYDTDQTLSANFIIAADGKNSSIAKKLGIEIISKPYNHTAIICDIQHTLPHNSTAIENFTPHGSFGILPQKQPFTSSIVWSLPTEMAGAFLKLTDDLKFETLKMRIPDSLGQISLISSFNSYPITLSYATEYFKDRTILLGDALHAIHPLAGQGLNLSLRDMKYIYDSLITARSLGLDIGLNWLLNRYESERSHDNNAMIFSTHMLHHAFANQSRALSTLTTCSMKILDKISLLKNCIQSYAEGR